ncbi:MAG: dicarboxylate/amino acid:cation symporter [Candidatus Azotimanducaceae bacterium]
MTDRSALTKKILLGMFSGLLLGSLAHSIALDDSNPIMQFGINGLIDLGGQIFIVTLKLLVVPLVFVSLACGASNLSGGTSLGRIGIKTLVLYLFTTAAAISLALIVANIINPGLGMSLASDTVFVAKESPPIKQVFLEIFPSNPVKAMAEGNMLQVIVFAILVGVAISKSGEHGSRLRDSLDDWNEVIMKLVLMLMSVAPIGVFCLMTTVFANMGFGGIFDLAKYFFNVVLVLVLHFALTYFLLLRFLAGLNPLRFYKDFYPVMVYAFSTSSSSATLPITLETLEKKMGVRKEVASFTAPLGATINMDGTAIMQGVATVFIAQAYSVEIGLAGYMTVILTATMASIGTAGVPGVGLITLALVLQQVGLPVEGIALIIGVDRLLDMLRTSVNVGGDATVASIVAKSEGKLDY